MSEKQTRCFQGRAYIASNGQMVIDSCVDDTQHLCETKIVPPNDRPRCRMYLSDMIPKEWLNQRGNFIVTVSFEPMHEPNLDQLDVG